MNLPWRRRILAMAEGAPEPHPEHWDGKYELVRVLGRGAFSVVSLVRDTGVGTYGPGEGQLCVS